MKFGFRSKRLERLYTEEWGAHRYPTEVVEAFFEIMAVIAAAGDERDLRALKGLRFEKLKGRGNDRSLRLTKQWRLIVTVEEVQSKGEREKRIVVHAIEDYHH